MRLLCFVILGFTGSALFFSSCYIDSGEELYGIPVCDSINVSFSTSIVPILQTYCYECHSNAMAEGQGGSNFLEGYENVIGYVIPGDPEHSSLYGSVAWLPAYIQMPKKKQQLSECDIAIIKKWITDGAQAN